MKNIISLSAFIVLSFIISSLLLAQGEEKTPKNVIMGTVERGLKVLKNASLKENEDVSEYKKKLWENIEPIFDLKVVSRRALGRYWRQCDDKQREEFTQVFTEILKNIYLDKSFSYSGEEIIFIREDIQGNRSKVQTEFITKENKKISVDFSMYKTENNWKIYDVAIEGVSIIGNYRSQFNSILNNASFNDLIKKLKEKKGKLIKSEQKGKL